MRKFLVCLILGILVLPTTALAVAADVPGIAGKIKTLFVNIGSAIIVIGWIITGILFLTASGDPEKLGKAKKALIACVIGTALIILAVTAEAIITSAL